MKQVKQHQKVTERTLGESSATDGKTYDRVPAVGKSSGDDSKSYDRAVTGLDSLRTGLGILCELGLLHGATALEKIRLGIEELETQLEESMAFQQKHPEGGTLLQVQVCSAAGNEDPPEWSMGKLYASTDALLFESCELPSWRVGPLKWSDIASLQTLRGGDVRLEISSGPEVYLFAGLSKLDVLEKFGGLTKESSVAKVTKGLSKRVKQLLSFSKSDGEAQTPELAKTGSIVASPSCTPDSWLEHYGAGPEKNASVLSLSSPPVSPKVGPSSAAEMLSFVQVADQLPEGAPTDMQAILQIPMSKATIEGIREVLSMDDNWPLCSFLEEHLKITDVEETTWAPSHRIPGTLTRRLRFRMPVPADVPQAVKRLVSLPETTHVTFLARLGCSANKIILVQEVCSHDVTYGENFWAQDVMAFKTDPAGGVLFEKFATIRWVVALPWYAGVLGTFIEMKAKEDSKNAGIAFAKYLQRDYGL